jgi:cell pole-organizing protein PopZ
MAYFIPSVYKRKFVGAEWAETLSEQVVKFEARIQANRERNAELMKEKRARVAAAKREKATAKRQAKSMKQNKQSIVEFTKRVKSMKKQIKAVRADQKS